MLGEEVEIWSRMLAFDRFRNLVEFVMLDPGSRQLKSVMHSEFAYFSIQKAKPAAPGQDTLNLFEQIALFPGEKIADFTIGDRLKQIRSELA